MAAADYVWGGLLLAGVAFEAYALRNGKSGDTLSEVTRSTFRVKTSKIGRVAFGTTWTAFAVWFLGHVLWGWDFPGF